MVIRMSEVNLATIQMNGETSKYLHAYRKEDREKCLPVRT